MRRPIPGEPSDEELLAAYRAGNGDAGKELYSRHWSVVRSIFRNKCSTDELPDLIQETLARSLTARFDGRGSFLSFLCGIAEFVRRENGRKRDRDRPFPSQSVEDLGADVHEVAASREECRILTKALRRLPVEHQTVLEMQLVAQMSVEEISNAIEIDYNTTNGRIQKAKAKLREIIMALSVEERLARSTIDNLEEWGRAVRAEWDAEQAEDESAPAVRSPR